MAKFETDCEATISTAHSMTGNVVFKRVKAKRIKLITDDEQFAAWNFFAYSAIDNDIAKPNGRHDIAVIEGCSGQAIGFGNTLQAAKSDAEMNLN